MPLIQANISTLEQLQSVIKSMNDEQYSHSLEVLSQASIGQHIRHIIEFYECLFESRKNGVVNYDKRKRNPLIEESTDEASARIDRICSQLTGNTEQHELKHEISLGNLAETAITQCKTSFERELVYALEHCIHHLAIIKIGLKNHFPEITIPENLGVAPSTQRHQQNVRIS